MLINIKQDEIPETCFDCQFAKCVYDLTVCPFTSHIQEDHIKPPRNCPFRNSKKEYEFNSSIYTNNRYLGL